MPHLYCNIVGRRHIVLYCVTHKQNLSRLESNPEKTGLDQVVIATRMRDNLKIALPSSVALTKSIEMRHMSAGHILHLAVYGSLVISCV